MIKKIVFLIAELGVLCGVSFLAGVAFGHQGWTIWQAAPVWVIIFIVYEICWYPWIKNKLNIA